MATYTLTGYSRQSNVGPVAAISAPSWAHYRCDECGVTVLEGADTGTLHDLMPDSTEARALHTRWHESNQNPKASPSR